MRTEGRTDGRTDRHDKANSSFSHAPKNVVEPGNHRWKNNTMQGFCMVFISKATDTHLEYIILIAFPLLRYVYFRERVQTLRLYVHYLSYEYVFHYNFIIILLVGYTLTGNDV